MNCNAPPDSGQHWLNRPLAIIGMACRLPGADGLDAFWQLLSSGGYAIERMPDDKLDRRLYYDARKGQRGKTYSDIGGFVLERELDWELLGLSPEEAQDWDGSHLNFCEVAAQACQHAGMNPRDLPYRNTGVYVGHSGGTTLGGELAYGTLATDYVELLGELSAWHEVGQELGGAGDALANLQAELVQRLQANRPQRRAGRPFVDAGFAAALVSRTLKLTGPHLAIDAACASSLVALALGASSLHAGETDMAIIGGASYNKSDSLILFSNAQSCSATATRPFDDEADGLISSEGYVAIVVKTLQRAIDDGDRIQAVIRGIGVSSDGRGRSLWAPRKEGQIEAIGRAYSADVTPDSVQLIEAHATSTQVGDATEMEALSSFYQQFCSDGKRLPVGSVKSNIGHTLETAGLAGLVKSVLAIQHATIPPSVNLQKLSASIPWSEIPLYVPQQCETWPTLATGIPRRAAVNAFGIGGLNVHVVVDQYLPQTSSTANRATIPATVLNKAVPPEPIAIVGRGVVLPGALHVQAFEEFLKSPQSVAVAPPPNRRNEHAAGFIRDFAYDWRRHKVPPKQIAQANPLQFMLLEATEQAFREAGMLDRESDRRHTAVVVGSTFGGDFGNALFAGLRLPEFRLHLHTLLRRRGVSETLTNRLIDQYETHFLEVFPALIDETGSFTSSTLASRLSKTFDLMGGAMAIDAGDTSGMAALNTACQLLRGGSVSGVLCAAASRALDRAAMENLQQLGRLRICDGEARVGEGVALVILRRLSDAQRDGQPVLGIITEVAVGFDAGDLSHSIKIAAQRLDPALVNCKQVVGGTRIAKLDQAISAGIASVNSVSLTTSRTVGGMGHLQATQGLADVIAGTISQSKSEAEVDSDKGRAEQQIIAAQTPSGQSYLVALRIDLSSGAAIQSWERHTAQPPQVVCREARDVEAFETFRFQASSREALSEILQSLATNGLTPEQATGHAAGSFGSLKQWRASIVCQPSELRSKAHTLSGQVGNQAARLPLAEQGLMWASPEQLQPQRIAFLFPGQGSQSSGMLREFVQSDAAAQAALAEANAALHAMGEPSFEHIAWDAGNLLGESVWHTQAAVLVADWIMFRAVLARGIQPTIVAGHSFGEFAALLAAGCWDFATALRATWHRCRSINEYVPSGCAMLSIQADADRTANLIAASGLPVHISHRNAPLQTVVGGRQAAVAQLAVLLEEENIVSRLLPVPTAFHTPALQAAVKPFRAALEPLDVRAPQLPILSSVTGALTTEPNAIRDALATQLISPLNFVEMVQQLHTAGITLAIEVGPQQVLSRLVRQIEHANAPNQIASAHVARTALNVVPTDNPKRGTIFQLLCATATAELFSLQAAPTSSLIAGPKSAMPASPQTPQLSPFLAPRIATVIQPIHFDATEVRRSRLRLAASQSLPPDRPTPPPAATAHFDATNVRRQANQQLARQPIPRSTNSRPSINQSAQEAPSQTPAASPTLPATAADAVASTETISKFLIDFVVEQTGYPADIIELNWDIEADLGIDSIKKAQLFGELREFFDLESHRGLKLDAFHTLQDIVNLLQHTPGKGDWLGHANNEQPGGEEAATAEYQIHSAKAIDDRREADADVAAARFTMGESGATGLSRDDMQRFLIDFVVEQTGYPPEIVEMDADLEADLGIDSIKKAQLFGELREMFNFQQATATDASGGRRGLAEYRTLADVLETLAQASPNHSQPASLEERTAERPKEASVADSTDKDCPTDSKSVGQSEIFVAGKMPKAASKSVDGWGPSSLPHLLPLARQGSQQLHLNAAFSQAIHENLRRFASRTGHDAETIAQVLQNGSSTWYEGRAHELAEAAQTLDKSLCALDRTLQVQAKWKPFKYAPTEVVAVTSDMSVAWLAEFHTPAWIGSSTAVGIVERRSSYSIGVPGTLVHLACVSGHVLRVGGLSSTASNQAACLAKLAQHLELAADSGEQALTAARSLQLAHDWWILIVDAATQKQILVESSKGTLVIEKSDVGLGSAGNDNTSATAMRLGLDRARNRFVLQTQQTGVTDLQGLPFATCEPLAIAASIPLATDERIEPVPEKSHRNAVTVASRYVLRLVPTPLRDSQGRLPTWSGTAVVIGDNPIARQLEARLRGAGVETVRWHTNQDAHALADAFEQLTRSQIVPHLFITSACDADAKLTLDAAAWQARRNHGLMGVFWLCQKWIMHIAKHDLFDEASIVAVTSLGGDFGISGNLHSAEGGGIAGLLKSMLVENWMQGHRTLPIKIIDASTEHSPGEIVGNIWHELANPNYQIEVSYVGGVRHALRAIAQPLPKAQVKHPIRRGGTWVCTGGARGITAFVAEQLAGRYDLDLHLLGMSPNPNIDPAWHSLDENGLRQLKAAIMTSAREAGKNAVKTWQDTEKLIEIDATLRRFQGLGYRVHYHSCDVSDRAALQHTLARVRAISGPINGILHGAGVGRDSRFDRKQPDKVNQCIAAKVDGALALMEATATDPLKYFVGFGSISGRFGANGHADYSLANDMLCKTIDWFQRQRPDVTCVGFHWHAWGDVGMATKPETQLALEMIDMQFMPAAEGIEHLIDELESDTRETEVLITDERYHRMYYHTETLGSARTSLSNVPPSRTPLLLPSNSPADEGGWRQWSAPVDPAKDAFLTDHLLDGRPLLPYVVAAEMMLEAAGQHLNLQRLRLVDVEALGAVRFFHDAPQELRVRTRLVPSRRVECELLSDFRARDGRLVDANRCNFRAIAEEFSDHATCELTRVDLPRHVRWEKPVYPNSDAKFHVGWSLQRLRKFTLTQGGLVGRISAPALIELAGPLRDVRGWRLPCSALDACLFATGILAWQQLTPGTALPVKFGQLSVSRLPSPGEVCEVHVQLKGTSPGTASFDFSLYGIDGQTILNANDYQVAWITADAPTEVAQR
ncbi:MAG: SDR family NAD(P)-dependent oxidoreductase [Pirellulaceae bacterium]